MDILNSNRKQVIVQEMEKQMGITVGEIRVIMRDPIEV